MPIDVPYSLTIMFHGVNHKVVLWFRSESAAIEAWTGYIKEMDSKRGYDNWVDPYLQSDRGARVYLGYPGGIFQAVILEPAIQT